MQITVVLKQSTTYLLLKTSLGPLSPNGPFAELAIKSHYKSSWSVFILTLSWERWACRLIGGDLAVTWLTWRPASASRTPKALACLRHAWLGSDAFSLLCLTKTRLSWTLHGRERDLELDHLELYLWVKLNAVTSWKFLILTSFIHKEFIFLTDSYIEMIFVLLEVLLEFFSDEQQQATYIPWLISVRECAEADIILLAGVVPIADGIITHWSVGCEVDELAVIIPSPFTLWSWIDIRDS